MGNQPIVSVIINNYNYKEFLKKAIDSALSQTYKNIEVIVVDDGSTDGSQDLITTYGNRIIPCCKDNGGQPSAMNVGFAKSRGDIICLLDSDDSFEENKVAEIVSIFNLHPGIGWCFHSLKLLEQNKQKPIAKSRAFPNKKENISQKCDFRDSLKKGRLNFYAPATSGLCFKKSNLVHIFPLPEFLGNSVDRYIAYAAMSIDEGYFLAKELTTQLIHGKNNITHQESKIANCRRALYAIIVAYALQFNFSNIKWFNHRNFSRGLAMSWQYGLPSTAEKEYVQEYLNSISRHEKLFILSVAILRFLLLNLNSQNHNIYLLPSSSKMKRLLEKF